MNNASNYSKDLSKNYEKYSGKFPIINFSVDYGEIFGLIGPVGAGKQTIRRILTL